MKLTRFDTKITLNPGERGEVNPRSRGRTKNVMTEEMERRRKIVLKAMEKLGGQTAVANRLGIDRAGVSRWAAGIIAVPKKHMEKIKLMAGIEDEH